MFTGLVEAVGTVVSFEAGVLLLSAPNVWRDPIDLGESIAVNGCCLTVIEPSQERDNLPLRFELSQETLDRTALGAVRTGQKVNIERAMQAGARFGGHIVQGHVDATGELVSITPSENAHIFRFRVPAEYRRYLLDKGSITVDGISLTVVQPEGNEFDVWVIPHTLRHTNLGGKMPGDRVNLEFDVLAKYVERLLAAREQG